ncbi:uncharacterized protein KD926_003248 [Aspergillus affinis]|uniref:uncharacterized protein n=1 Tax=Aspergillus affinis TaxID=1070780 RepID=UPI0022FE5D1E|nr:uncharacterized protein KD926_003248 [Aspergillus affinis]KAI9035546.1 hypothetical protein KD926_003248 [Aspergillus affinis]
MSTYGFDSIDIDWEYPAADDRGRIQADTADLVKLVKELYEACDSQYRVTITLPTSYWYLKGFDLPGMSPYVDLFNIMAYNIYGTWDSINQWTDPVINPYTNLTEISNGLDLIRRNNIDPAKVFLGLGFYGRSFTLKDPSCTDLGCPFANTTRLGSSSGRANPGKYTSTSGILSNYEIARVIDYNSPEIQYDVEAELKVRYDSETLIQKRDFANSLCLGNPFAWALDLRGPGTISDLSNMDPNAGMEGATPDGSDSDSENVFIGQDIYSQEYSTIRYILPCNFIFPPMTLSSATTISFEPCTTDLGGSVYNATALPLEHEQWE